MSTVITAPPASLGLPITREERDALYGDLHFNLDEGLQPELDRESVLDLVRRAEMRIAFCDALGWQREDDRKDYHLPAIPVDELRHWLGEWRDSAARMAEHDDIHMTSKAASGDPDYFTAGSAAATLRNTLDLVTGDLGTAIACCDILDRLAEVA